jgi:hypothetical protein
MADCLGNVCRTFFARFSSRFEYIVERRGSDAWTLIAPIVSPNLLLGFNEYGATFDVVDSLLSPHSWTKTGCFLATVVSVPRLANESSLAILSSGAH